MSKGRWKLACLVGALLCGAATARAHTPYLLPNAFDAERDHVTLQGSLTEDDYFRPDIALKATSYVEITPTGEHQALAPAAVLKDLALVEAALPEPGTYRFSTGALVGRHMRMAEVGGRWLMVRPTGAPERRGSEGGTSAGHPQHAEGPPTITEADLPPGAKTVEVDNVMTAETYVSKGAPTDATLKPTGQGLELKPLVHPNSIYVDAGFPFQLLVDGRPAAGLPVDVYREGDVYDEKKLTSETRTDGDGRGKVAFDRPGVYLLTARTPGRSPGEAPQPRSYVYSLTFEVSR
jgi:hypothetical protein